MHAAAAFPAVAAATLTSPPNLLTSRCRAVPGTAGWAWGALPCTAGRWPAWAGTQRTRPTPATATTPCARKVRLQAAVSVQVEGQEAGRAARVHPNISKDAGAWQLLLLQHYMLLHALPACQVLTACTCPSAPLQACPSRAATSSTAAPAGSRTRLLQRHLPPTTSALRQRPHQQPSRLLRQGSAPAACRMRGRHRQPAAAQQAASPLAAAQAVQARRLRQGRWPPRLPRPSSERCLCGGCAAGL